MEVSQQLNDRRMALLSLPARESKTRGSEVMVHHLPLSGIEHSVTKADEDFAPGHEPPARDVCSHGGEDGAD